MHFNLLGEPQTIGQKLLVVVVMILAGIVEGLITGYFQWVVLKRRFAGVKGGNWLGFTAFSAALGNGAGEGVGVGVGV